MHNTVNHLDVLGFPALFDVDLVLDDIDQMHLLEVVLLPPDHDQTHMHAVIVARGRLGFLRLEIIQ